MTEELKARIAQINAGTAPAGYKKTKVGIVPEEWEVSEIGKQLVEYRELSNDIEQYPVYSSSRKGLMPQSDYYDKKDAVQTNLGYKMVPVGYATYRHMSDDDIFHFNINSTGSTILVSSEYPVFTAKPTADQYFVITSLNETARFRYFCRTQKLGGTRTRLYFSNLAKYKLALPPLPEQQKIAEILTAQDSLISLLQKRIELKQQQKQGLIENLVTGKVRLFGFSGQWDKVPLRNILRERKTFSQKGFEYPHVTLSTEGIYPKTERFNRDHLVKSEEKEYKITLYNDICYNPANLKFGVICRNTFGSAIFSPIYVTFEVVNGHNVDFIAHYLMRWNFINAVRKYEEGTVYERMAVKPDDFLKFKIPLPPRPEQEKIAEILSAQDKEIELLQQQLALEQQKKKALMQLLLTGKVRCV